MSKLRPTMLYLFITELAFYILPLLVFNEMSAMLLMVLIFPLISFICAFLAGRKHPFTWAYPIAIFIIFLPTVFFYYGISAAVYAFLYTGLTIIGLWVGGYIVKRAQTKNQRLK